MAETPDLDITNSSTWPEWLTVEEAALVLRCSVKTVRRRIAAYVDQTEGRTPALLPLPAQQVSTKSRWMIARADVLPRRDQ